MLRKIEHELLGRFRESRRRAPVALPWPWPRLGSVLRWGATIRKRMSYDRADYDYSTDEEPLPKGHAGTHIGMFLAWAILNSLESGFHRQHSVELLMKVRQRQITGRQFFEAACPGKFSEQDLDEQGNAFAQHYYKDAAGKRGAYFADYKRALAADLPSFWHVADTWENFDKIAPVISERYERWKNPPRKRWWQFWK